MLRKEKGDKTFFVKDLKRPQTDLVARSPAKYSQQDVKVPVLQAFGNVGQRRNRVSPEDVRSFLHSSSYHYHRGLTSFCQLSRVSSKCWNRNRGCLGCEVHILFDLMDLSFFRLTVKEHGFYMRSLGPPNLQIMGICSSRLVGDSLSNW